MKFKKKKDGKKKEKEKEKIHRRRRQRNVCKDGLPRIGEITLNRFCS